MESLQNDAASRSLLHGLLLMAEVTSDAKFEDHWQNPYSWDPSFDKQIDRHSESHKMEYLDFRKGQYMPRPREEYRNKPKAEGAFYELLDDDQKVSI